MEIRHLNQNALAARWAISPRTLERWRWAGEGPLFIKLGGRVVYRLKDIEHSRPSKFVRRPLICHDHRKRLTP